MQKSATIVIACCLLLGLGQVECRLTLDDAECPESMGCPKLPDSKCILFCEGFDGQTCVLYQYYFYDKETAVIISMDQCFEESTSPLVSKMIDVKNDGNTDTKVRTKSGLWEKVDNFDLPFYVGENGQEN